MKKKLISRLERLEARCQAMQPQLRYGILKRLPPDYEGERHIVVVSENPMPTSPHVACVFEERAGRAPRGTKVDNIPRAYMSEDDLNL